MQDYTRHLVSGFLHNPHYHVTIFSKVNGRYDGKQTEHRPTYANQFFYRIKFLRLFYLFFELAQLRQYVRKKNIDVVHVQWTEAFLVYWLFLKTLPKNVVCVYTCHNTTPLHGISGWKARLQAAGFKRFVNLTDCIVVHTQYSKRKLLGEGVTSQIFCIPHGPIGFYPDVVSNIEWSAKKGNNSDEGTLRVVMFGVISSYKGYLIASNAIRDVLPGAKNLEIIVAGRQGPNSKDVVESLEKLSQDFPRNVFCQFEFISEGDAHRLFCLADCLLLPYEHIDQSGVVSAAVHYGIPIVCSDLPGFSETVDHGVNGYLFKGGDVKALAELLREIASDPRLIRDARKGMRDYSSSFIGWKEIAALHYDLYEVKC